MNGVRGQLLSQAFLDSQAGRMKAATRVESWRASLAELGPTTPLRTLLLAGAAPLVGGFGFDPPVEIQPTPSGLDATVTADGQRIALLIAPFAQPLDPLWRTAVTGALRRAAAWSILFNGIQLRLVDVGRVYARRYLEFDLDVAATDPQTALVLSTVLGHLGSLRALTAASDRHAAGVSRALRDGVLAASRDVLDALAVGRRPEQRPQAGECLEQALTIVFRLLFLLFAEARLLVPLWHPVYRDSYSVESLRAVAEQSPPARGLWDTLRAMARLAHAGCHAGDLHVTPFNGRLFAPARTPLAERTDLDDRKAQSAVLALSTRRAAGGGGRERITYQDLGVEQLGAVYETLLDYAPRRDPDGRITLRAESGLRKATGTFYTPLPIADHLVRRTLAPLVTGRTPEDILQLRIVDPAMGSGAFLVAACRYLAGAYEAALIEGGRSVAADLSDTDRTGFRRRIAERCLYGVDLNPMAVQLARLSLWLTTLTADRPLSFLDHRLQTGDSVLGAWLSQLRHPPSRRPLRPRVDSLPLFEADAAADAVRAALPVRFSLETIPNDTLAEVRAKERAHAAALAHDAALTRWKRVADVWCAAWFSSGDVRVPPQAFGDLADAILHGACSLPPKTIAAYLDAAETIAATHRFFHWELEFPEAFFGPTGERLTNAGFDAVIGNPPWDMIRADAPGGPVSARDRQRVAAILRFRRDAGAYHAQGRGHANQYQLFVERAIGMTRCGGRIGLVLPSGFATDHGSAALRRALLTQCDVDALAGFDNHRGVFPIHRGVRFLIVSATAGRPTRSIACRLGLDDPARLDAADEPPHRSSWYPVHVSPETLERISGPALTIPRLTSSTDFAIVERATSLFAPLGSAEGWAAHFGRELNATDDRQLFRGPGDGLPVVDGKHLLPFGVDRGRIRRTITAADARRALRSEGYERARLAYRDVASATNRVTLIAALLPAHCVSTHTVFCLRTPLPLAAQHFLCGLFNSLVVNYLVRLVVTTHVTTALVEQLPIPLTAICARGERGDRPHRTASRASSRSACLCAPQHTRRAPVSIVDSRISVRGRHVSVSGPRRARGCGPGPGVTTVSRADENRRRPNERVIAFR